LVNSLSGQAITLMSLEKAIDIIEPYIVVFHDLLSKAVPTNFEALEERSKGLSDISEDEDSFSEDFERQKEVQSFVEDQLLTNEEKTVYIINYLHSYISLNCSNIMDRELIEVIIEIFIDTLTPYLETLSEWFTESANSSNNGEDWTYDTNEIKLPKFLKPYMTEILHIRKSLMVIQIVRDELIIGKNPENTDDFAQYRTW